MMTAAEFEKRYEAVAAVSATGIPTEEQLLFNGIDSSSMAAELGRAGYDRRGVDAGLRIYRDVIARRMGTLEGLPML